MSNNQIFTVYVEGQGVGLIPILPSPPGDDYARLTEEERKTVNAYAGELAFHLNALGLPRPRW